MVFIKYLHTIIFFLLLSSLIGIHPSNALFAQDVSKQDTLIYHPQYYLLQKALSNYQYILFKGGWDSIPNDKTKSLTTKLRKRLEAEGYLINTNTLYPDSFDSRLTSALQFYQTNNGLVASGNLNTITLSTLNIPLEKRIEQIKINMQRWTTIPKYPGKHYLFVNAADFTLTVVEHDTTIMKMKIIVGKTYRETPVFSSKLTQIIFNPTWNIPLTILQNDILPLVLKDTSYLRKKHIRIFKTDKEGVRNEIPADSVHWENISLKYFPYELIQDPVPENALGVVKFMFPNNNNVYMHDTPAKELFEKTEPTLSSGCIRLSRAVDLAYHILEHQKGWTRKKITNIIKSGETVTINLNEPIEVYIEYFTAWVNEKGHLQFRKDIYNRDNTDDLNHSQE